MAYNARRRGKENGLDAWPGYVDALSTLLMVIIFVLLVFVLAQAFLSVTLSGRDKALDQVNRQLAEMSDMLSLERGRTADLRASMADLNKALATSNAARETLAQQLATLTAAAARTEADRNGLRDDRDQETAHVAGDLAEARRQLADMRQQMAALDQTVTADKATIEARLSDLAKLAEQTRALTALRDQLEQQAQDAAARATTEQQRREATEALLADEKKLGDSARAQVALLTQQVEQLRAQLAGVAKALDIAEASGRDKDAQITNLGQRLNTALAAKVEELQRYRSDFFGKLRAVLANRPGIQVVGDRFVFQSEVLFPVGGADMTSAGQDQIRALATTIKQIAAEIPPDVHWILRVDGHADRQKVTGGAFASNWELSAARAISVVKLLIDQGVPPDHLAATAFGDNQPLDPADTPDAYARNRRIELRLTDR
jgi:chemotaxis protein MotB